MAVPVVPAKAGTQSVLDSGFCRNDMATPSDITSENPHKATILYAENVPPYIPYEPPSLQWAYLARAAKALTALSGLGRHGKPLS